MIVALMATVLVWSCGPAEYENSVTYELEALCTVNKSRIEPEFSDSTYLFARNVDEFGLKTGDRAFMSLTCTYNLYSTETPLWTIVDVKRVPVYPLSADIDTAAYVTPVTGLEYLNFFDDFEAKTWIWKGKQNINIKYRGVEEDASFAMTVRGVKDGYVEFDLFVNAKESDTEIATLLTFDISNVADFLSDEEKAQLPTDLDEIKTTIYMKRMNNGRLEDWPINGDYIRY